MYKKESIVSLILMGCLFAPCILFFYEEGIAKGLSYDAFFKVVIESGKFSLFLKSTAIAFGSSMLALMLGFVVSFSIIKTNIKAARYFIFLFLLPLAVPPFVYIEVLVFISKITGGNLFSLPVMIGLFCIVYMPFTAIILGSGILSIPSHLEESALLVSPGNKWFSRISLRWLLPYFITAFLITFLFIFSNYEIPSLMNVQTYTLCIFNQFGAFYNYKDALYLLVPVFFLFMAIVFCAHATIGHRSFFSMTIAPSRLVCTVSKIYKLALLLLLIALATAVLSPIGILFFKAASARHLGDIYKPYWKEIVYSFFVSACAGVFTVAIVSLFVRSMVLTTKKTKGLFALLALLPFAIPPAFIAFSLIQFSGKITGNSAFAASIVFMWGLSTRYFPIIVYILYANALKINPHLIEAGLMNSASWSRNMINIWIPLNFSAMKKAFFFFMLLALSEIGLAVLLVPPDCMTAAVNIYSMLHYGFEKEVAIETLLLVIIAVSLGFLILREDTRKNKMAEAEPCDQIG
jgi:iron(III) transport system permease protein